MNRTGSQVILRLRQLEITHLQTSQFGGAQASPGGNVHRHVVWSRRCCRESGHLVRSKELRWVHYAVSNLVG